MRKINISRFQYLLVGYPTRKQEKFNQKRMIVCIQESCGSTKCLWNFIVALQNTEYRDQVGKANGKCESRSRPSCFELFAGPLGAYLLCPRRDLTNLVKIIYLGFC